MVSLCLSLTPAAVVPVAAPFSYPSASAPNQQSTPPPAALRRLATTPPHHDARSVCLPGPPRQLCPSAPLPGCILGLRPAYRRVTLRRCSSLARPTLRHHRTCHGATEPFAERAASSLRPPRSSSLPLRRFGASSLPSPKPGLYQKDRLPVWEPSSVPARSTTP